VGADDQTKPSKSSDSKWQATSVDILIEISSLLANLGHLPFFCRSLRQHVHFLVEMAVFEGQQLAKPKMTQQQIIN